MLTLDSWLLCSDFTCERGICYRSASVCSRPIHLLLSQTGILQKWMIRSPAFCIDARPTHTCLTALFPGPPRVGRYQKGKTNLGFTEARDSEWQWHQLGHMQVCTSLQTDNDASTSPLSFLQAGCPSCRRTNSVKALKALCAIARLGQAYTNW